jgi:hypothetical protein
MHSTLHFSRFAVVLMISVAATSALDLGSVRPGGPKGGPFMDHVPASTAPLAVAQFSPCPNGKCR